jgi:2-methylisocitrate lyase-like PEP mutase family enzyme
LLPVPQIVNIIFGGKAPPVSQQELAHIGFDAVLYVERGVASVREVLGSPKSNGSLDEVRSHLTSFDERQKAVAKDHYDALEARYRN